MHDILLNTQGPLGTISKNLTNGQKGYTGGYVQNSSKIDPNVTCKRDAIL